MRIFFLKIIETTLFEVHFNFQFKIVSDVNVEVCAKSPGKTE